MKKYLFGFVTMLVLLGLAVVNNASATAVRDFTATISPTTASVGTTHSYTITITNSLGSGGGEEIESAIITVPVGWTSVTGFSSVPNWNTTLVGSEIKLVFDGATSKLNKGESLALTFTATAPATSTSSEWNTRAFKKHDFKDEFTITSSQPVVVVSAPVLDVTPPVIDSHSDILGVQATSPSGATVTFTVNSTDDTDGVLPAVCVPSSGSTFPMGTTTVTCNKTDSSENVATSTSFLIEVIDTEPPVITLDGSNPQNILITSPYVELGATVTDNYDTGLVASINASAVDTSVLGAYEVTYDAVDSSGNHATQIKRTVNVIDQEEPIINLNGANPQIIEVHTPYVELGATVYDNHDVGLVATIDSSGVNTDVLGTSYEVIYTVEDSSLNRATTTRAVHVVDTTAPVITIIGSNPMHLLLGDTYSEPGATALDNYDASSTVNATGTVDTSSYGTYTITYTSTDSSGNTSTSTREVIVRDLGRDSSLLSLSTSEGTLNPVFSSSTLEYTVVLPLGTTVIPTVSATTTDPFATSTITQATSITSATTSERTATVVVTSEDKSEGMTQKTYTVVFSVASAPTLPPTSSGGGGGGGSSGSYLPGYGPGSYLGSQIGSVLGAAIDSTSTCDLFKTFMKRGGKNNRAEVLKLQQFLNEQLGLRIPLTGLFGSLTENAVKKFQLKYSNDVLIPWINAGRMRSVIATGYFFKTTQHQANKLLCPNTTIEAPDLR